MTWAFSRLTVEAEHEEEGKVFLKWIVESNVDERPLEISNAAY